MVRPIFFPLPIQGILYPTAMAQDFTGKGNNGGLVTEPEKVVMAEKQPHAKVRPVNIPYPFIEIRCIEFGDRE